MYRFFEMLVMRILNSIFLLYLIIFWTGWRTIFDLFDGSWYYAQMMHESGNLSVSYLIMTLSVSPTLIIFSRLGIGKEFGRWLLKRRKHFGVASFLYAVVHTLHYVRYIADAKLIWLEAFDFEYLMGWLALIIFLALAVTSNRQSTRRLGRRWKTLHRFVYVAALMTWLHWYLFEFFTEEVFFWGGLLVVGKLIQFGLRRILDALRPEARSFKPG